MMQTRNIQYSNATLGFFNCSSNSAPSHSAQWQKQVPYTLEQQFGPIM